MTPDKMATPDDKMRGRNGRITTRLAVSAPAGLAALLLVGAVAFGHEGLFPRSPDSDSDNVAATAKPEATAEPTPEPTPKETATEKPEATPKADEVAKADPTPKPEATPKPAPVAAAKTPKPQPAPQPVTTALALSASATEYPGKVVLSWSQFSGDAFGYYKLVRSHDATATWPTSGDDELIGAFGGHEETWAKDRPPQCGVPWFYRVFAVRDGDHEVLAPSNTVSGTATCMPAPTPKPEPTPTPATEPIGFEASFGEGQVQLSWGACAGEHFNAYKVVRSQTNPEPMYPENEGTELIAAIGDPAQTFFADAAVASGQTWFYRVLARADSGGGTYIACQTQALSVTIP